MRFILLIALILPLSVFCQEYADSKYYLVDSLVLETLAPEDSALLAEALNTYHTATSDTTKLAALSEICDNMMDNAWVDYQFEQQALLEEALSKNISKAEETALLKIYASALNNIGYIYNSQNNFEAALQSYFSSLKIRKKLAEPIEIAQSFHNIAFIYDNQGNIALAIEYYLKSIAIKERISDKQGMGISLNNLGIIYNHQKNYVKAVDYYKRSLAIQEDINDKEGIALSLVNIGLNYQNQRKIPEAIDYYERSLKIQQEIDNQRGIAVSFNQLGKVYFLKAKLEKQDHLMDSAQVFIEKALAIQRNIQDKEGITVSLHDIGSIALRKGKITQALNVSLEGYTLAQELGYPKLIQQAAKQLSDIYKTQGNGMKALEMHELFVIMKDSISNQNLRKESSRQEAKYEYEKQKAVDDKEHEKQMAVAEEKQKQQRLISYAAGGGALLLVLFLLFVFNRLRVTRKQKKVIEEQKVEVDLKNTEILDSINYAKRIQEAILPTEEEVNTLLPNSFIYYRPKDIVAGDFYWVVEHNNLVFFAAADCTGHGVPGAMVSVVCHTALNRVIRDIGCTDPGELLDQTRVIIEEQLANHKDKEATELSNLRDGMDIALCVWNKESNVLNYAGAYNPLWILRANAEEIEEIKATKQAIGKVENPIPFESHELALNKGDQIFVFSDGYADQFGGPKGKKFRYASLKRMLISIAKLDSNDQLAAVNTQFLEWQGELEQVDDVCVIGVKI